MSEEKKSPKEKFDELYEKAKEKDLSDEQIPSFNDALDSLIVGLEQMDSRCRVLQLSLGVMLLVAKTRKDTDPDRYYRLKFQLENTVKAMKAFTEDCEVL